MTASLAAKVRSDAELSAAAELAESVANSDLKSIRVVFVDQHGVTRGKTIMANALASVLDAGLSITSTLLLKDTSHRTVFPIWQDDAGFGKGIMTGASDFLMLPDAATFKTLPWSPDTGWVLCDIFEADGTPHRLSTRRILQDALARLGANGMKFIAGLEVEFYVLKLENPNLQHAHADWPETPPATSLISHGYQYLTENRMDQLDPVMAQIRDHATDLNLPIRTLEAEFGPSQFEVSFDPTSGLQTADNMVLFRNMVKQTCQRAGFHATFMCRPAFKNAMGNGWHLHQSLIDAKAGDNLFTPTSTNQLSPKAANWLAGLLKHAAASCILTTPTINGYKRYKPFALAPDRIQWGHDNRGAMLRMLAKPGDAASRIENRVGEPAANPYLYLASQVLAGLDGIENHLAPPPPVERPYADDATPLPADIHTALQAFQSSTFFRNSLGDGFVEYLTTLKSAEWQRYLATASDWEQREYFSLF